MAADASEPSLAMLLTDAEIETFRLLAREHAGAELSVEDARFVTGQLLRTLGVVRQAQQGGSNDSDSSVDRPALPNSVVRAHYPLD